MDAQPPHNPMVGGGNIDRRRAVLESAMETFARFGYPKASMDDVAKAAHISRPGLYFLFDSKLVLFREAVAHALGRDLALIALELDDTGRSLPEKLLSAFDLWAGSYIGPLAAEAPHAVAADPVLLGTALSDASLRFEELVTNAVTPSRSADGVARARTLISTSIGIKHQVSTRSDYLDRLDVAIALLLADPTASAPSPEGQKHSKPGRTALEPRVAVA